MLRTNLSRLTEFDCKCQSFIRPHLDYGDILFNQAYNKLLHVNLELIQYNVLFEVMWYDIFSLFDFGLLCAK